MKGWLIGGTAPKDRYQRVRNALLARLGPGLEASANAERIIDAAQPCTAQLKGKASPAKAKPSQRNPVKAAHAGLAAAASPASSASLYASPRPGASSAQAASSGRPHLAGSKRKASEDAPTGLNTPPRPAKTARKGSAAPMPSFEPLPGPGLQAAPGAQGQHQGYLPPLPSPPAVQAEPEPYDHQDGRMAAPSTAAAPAYGHRSPQVTPGSSPGYAPPPSRAPLPTPAAPPYPIVTGWDLREWDLSSSGYGFEDHHLHGINFSGALITPEQSMLLTGRGVNLEWAWLAYDQAEVDKWRRLVLPDAGGQGPAGGAGELPPL